MEDEKKTNLIKGQATKDVNNHLSKERVNDLLTSSLTDIQEKFKISATTTDDLILSADDNYQSYLTEYEKSITLITPDVEPIGMSVITSAMLMNLMEHGHHLMGEEFDTNLINSFKAAVADIQVVMAVGPDCRQVKIGDKVKVKLGNFFRVKNPNTVHATEVSEIPVLPINKKEYLSLHERDIEYIYQDEEYYQRREKQTLN